MKTLLLMRHAKSSWDDAALADHQRPLNSRGRKAAPQIGRLMRDQTLLPDHILCSTAERTRQTCELVTQSWDEPIATTFLNDLYHCPAAAVPDILQQVTLAAECILLIGHNPGLSDFLVSAVGLTEKFPTAALAWLSVDIATWSEFTTDSPMQLQNVWRPRDLPPSAT